MTVIDESKQVLLAKQIATKAHEGQVDKVGDPYIGHPARIAASLPESEVDGRIVAWLHDVVEDTTVTLNDLEQAGFPSEIIVAVDAITHRDDESNDEYYARVRANPIALRVKLADIADNSNEERRARLDPETAERLRVKYKEAIQVLTG